MEALLTVLGLGKLVNKTEDVTKSKLTKSKFFNIKFYDRQTNKIFLLTKPRN